MGARLELWRGADAMRRLTDPAFVGQWLALCDACPWTTPFQRPAFANTWYASYRPETSPLVVAGFDEAGTLVGLLTLAEFEGRLTAAGARQAEYQAWLMSPGAGPGFAARAILAARAAVPGIPFQLRYVPGEALAEGVAETPELRGIVEVIRHRRPLMRVESGGITASLRKKGNASRLNRLRRAGAKFERIGDAQGFAEVLDDIITLYDFRQGAINGDCPFADDPRKKAFHLAWMGAAPEQLHVTVLRAGDRLVSALVGVVGRDAMHVAIVTHSPFDARNSPGKLHLMLAALELAEKGIRHLDLTPGGAWKDRFADTHDGVFELRVHRRRADRMLATWVGHARSGIRRAVHAAGIDPKALVGALVAARRVRMASIGRSIGRWVRSDAELRLYAILPSAMPEPGGRMAIRKDCIEDLLRFEPAEPWWSRQAFLAAALARLEDGEHVFTISDGRRLLHCGWLAQEQTQALFTEIGQPFAFPEPGPVLHGFYTDPQARGRGYCRENLCHILSDVAASGTMKHVFVWVRVDEMSLRRAIEEIGFQCQGSFWHRRRFGRDSRRVLWHGETHGEALHAPSGRVAAES